MHEFSIPTHTTTTITTTTIIIRTIIISIMHMIYSHNNTDILLVYWFESLLYSLQ